MVKDILNFLLEAAEEEGEFKEVFGPGEREYTLDEIKAIEPGFFSRRNTKLFGTKKIYKYRGNYLVLKNVKQRQHGMFQPMSTSTDWVIYQFKRTEDTPQGLLLYVASARDLEDAKEMIKTRHFRDWHYRRMGLLPEAEEEGFKDVFEPSIQVKPVNPNWWRYRQESDWIYHPDRSWIISTNIFQEDRLSVQPITRPLGGTEEDYQVETMADIIIGLVKMARKSAFHEIVFSLRYGDGYDKMLEAIDQAEMAGELKILRRSGMALYAEVTDSRPHWFRGEESVPFNSDIDAILEALEGEEFKEVFTPDIREIQVFGKRWWRRGYGGEYNTARIYVNDQHVATLGENGGGGDQYLWRATQWLYDHGYIGDRRTPLRIYCEQHGIKLINDVTDVRRERDLDRPMNESDEEEPKGFAAPAAWGFKVEPETQGPEDWKVTIYHQHRDWDTMRSVGSGYFADKRQAQIFGQRVVEAARHLDAVHPYDDSHWRANAIWNWFKEHGVDYDAG